MQPENHLLVSVLAGSRAYGTSVDTSDTDIRGVYAARLRHMLSPFRKDTHRSGEGDTFFYELSRYISLLCKQNPNLVEILWAHPDDVQAMSGAWRLLVDARHDLLTTEVSSRYRGFAFRSMETLNRRRRELLEGAEPRPLEKAYGYDTKAAAHVIRLLRTCREILDEGVVHVRRPDAAELRAIREGAVSLDDIIQTHRDLDTAVLESLSRTQLPREVDHERVEALVEQMYDMCWRVPHLAAGVLGGGGQGEAGLGAGGQGAGGQGAEGRPTSGEDAGLMDAYNSGRAVVMDLEARGEFTPGVCSIVEIGMMEVIDGKPTGRNFHSFCDPQARVTRATTEIHGLTGKFLRGMSTFGSIVQDLLAFIGDSPLIAHDAASDWSILAHDLSAVGLPPLSRARFLCTQKMAQELYGQRRIGLDNLCALTGADGSVRRRGHTALGDTGLVVACLNVMKDRPGFAEALSRSWLKVQRPNVEPVPVRVQMNGNTASFTDTDGSVHVADVIKPDDYRVVVRKNAVLVVPPGETSPSNPDGPAIITLSSGRLLRIDRGRSEEPAPEQLSPGLS
ncbi:DNA polymerase beta superfamily protein [Gluconobacter potus]|uniref:DNA polymerase beta superfamily protein n=1 Tax=Gluconobacter potus TaxID=2724927 RepID=UPI0007833858|nr:nucleotidyltransferase domain-containing protein [Gluconobacter potus]